MARAIGPEPGRTINAGAGRRPAENGSLTGTQKLVGWVLFAFIVAVLIFATTADRPHPEGYTGSYLGRTVAHSAIPDNGLRDRTATQRF